MHDQGVTEQAVVTEWIRTSDPMSGVYDQVTRDPQGDVPIRLGPRPGAPGGVLATITLVVVLGTSLTLSTGAAAVVKDW